MTSLRLERLREAMRRTEHREKMRKMMRERLASGWRPSGPSEAGKVAIREANRRHNLGVPRTEAEKAAMRGKLKGIKHPPHVVSMQKEIGRKLYSEGRCALLRDDVAEAAAKAATAANKKRAKLWTVRSPAGVTYQFKNCNEWVAEHPELFDPKDWNLKTAPCGISVRPAANAIRQLNSTRRKPGRNGRIPVTANSWKGWQLVSVFDYDADPINRFTTMEPDGRVAVSNEKEA